MSLAERFMKVPLDTTPFVMSQFYMSTLLNSGNGIYRFDTSIFSNLWSLSRVRPLSRLSRLFNSRASSMADTFGKKFESSKVLFTEFNDIEFLRTLLLELIPPDSGILCSKYCLAHSALLNEPAPYFLSPKNLSQTFWSWIMKVPS